MAENADSVIVELVANTDKFNSDVKASATGFTASMGQIEQSAGGAEKAHSRLSLAANQNRIAMLELQHVVRGSTDQFAAGAPLTQIFAQHVASIGEAAALSGGGMGKFGAILAGPWGLAATAAVGIIATLIGKHHEEGDSVDSLVAKLKEHAEKTHNSEEADRIWGDTIDGLIDRQQKLNDALSKRLDVQALVDQADLEREKSDLVTRQKDLDDEKQRLASLQKQLSAQPAGSVGIGQGAGTIGVDSANISRQIDESKAKIADLNTAIQKLNAGITQSQIVIGQTQGKALADLATKAKLFGDTYEGVITGIVRDNPKLGASATTIETAAAGLSKAATDAAGAGVDFVGVTNQVSALDQGLDSGQVTVKTYAAEIAKLTKQLNDMTEAAKEANKHKVDPVSQFKQAVIGAEGTGPNKLGSPAAGFGQFTPDTWRAYFDKLFPDKVDIDDAAKLAYRNVRSVAEAVIDKATDDYKAVLVSAGQSITAANLYAVHLLGAPDAKKLFSASPGTDTRTLFNDTVVNKKGVVDQNPFLAGTVEQARAAIAKRIGDSSAAVSAGAVAIVQQLQQEKEREAKFQQAKDELEGQVIDARKGLATTALQVWAFETAAAISAHTRTKDQIDADEAIGKLLPQEATTLRGINDEREKYRQQLIDQRLRQAQFAEAEAGYTRGRDFQAASYEAEADTLHSQEQLAKTAEERRTIEARLIDLQFAEEKLKNQYIIDWAERVKANQDATQAEKDDAQLAENIAKMHQGTLDQRHADAQTGNAQQNASPLQSYFNSIPDTAKQIDDALEQVATNGLQDFVDGIAQAAAHFTSLGDVGRAVLQNLTAALVKMALQEIILHTVGRAASVASNAASVAQAAATGAAIAAAMSGPAALVSLATSGANSIGAQAGIASTIGLATVLGAPKAGGGRILGPGGDTSDSILTPTSADEYVLRAQSARSIGYDALEQMNATGQLPVSPSNSSATAPGGSGLGGISARDIDRLETAIVQSRSDVSLYASLDPAEVLQRALGARAGHRALLAHFNANSAAFNSALARKI